jgi:hypothetical protein
MPRSVTGSTASCCVYVTTSLSWLMAREKYQLLLPLPRQNSSSLGTTVLLRNASSDHRPRADKTSSGGQGRVRLGDVTEHRPVVDPILGVATTL